MVPYAREVEEDDHEIPESESPFRVKVPRPRELELTDATTKEGQQRWGQEEGNGVELVQQVVELRNEMSGDLRQTFHEVSTHRCDNMSALSMAECMHITSM